MRSGDLALVVLAGLVMQLPTAAAVALVPGDILTGAGNTLVRVETATLPATVTTIATLPDFVTDVAIEPTGSLAVTTWSSTTLAVGVYRVDPATGFAALVRSLTGGYPSVAVESNGNLLLNVRTEVLRLAPASGATLSQATVNCTVPVVLRGTGIAVDDLGQVFAVAGCLDLLRVDFAAGTAESIGIGYYTPFTDVAIDGSIVVLASSGFGPLGVTVQGFDTNGTWTGSFAPIANSIDEAFVAFDPVTSRAVVNLIIDPPGAPPQSEHLASVDPTTGAISSFLASSVGGATQTAGVAVVRTGVCSDQLDNDGDGYVDHPADPDCANGQDATEATPELLALTLDGRLLAVDDQTGAGTVVAATGLGSALALERAPDRTLLVIAGSNRLYWINPTTYAIEGDKTLEAYSSVSALAFSADGSILYGAASVDPDGRAERLIRIHPDHGTPTEIGVFGPGFQQVEALAVSPAGTLYAIRPVDCSPVTHCNPPAIGVVDPSTGAVVSSTGIDDFVFAADYDPNGNLLAATSSLAAGPSQLSRLAPATGVATAVGMLGFDGVTGLAAWSRSAFDLPDCGDGVDNDGDGLTDYPADLGCADASEVSEKTPLAACDDGADNDGDGWVDYSATSFLRDPGCGSATGASETSQCQNGVNDDGDGLIDFDGGISIYGPCSAGTCPTGVSDPNQDGVPDPDPHCVGKPWRNRERPAGCGLGVELALLLPVLTRLGLSRRHSVQHDTM